MNERVLGIFAKRPMPGQVKTRLAAETSPEWAAQVAGAFLGDTLTRLATCDADRVIAYAPDHEHVFFAQLAEDRYRVTPQDDGDLGRRLERFVAEQQRLGARRIVVVGSDSPTMPVPIVTQAFAELERVDVVLGPAMDGGYYLLGCAGRMPPIFDGISWGGPDVLAQTVARLSEPAWRLALLPPWYDVDTLADWRMLRGHLAASRRCGIDPAVPWTEALADPGGTP